MDISDPATVKRFFNGQGRIAAIPVKDDRKLQLLQHIATRFEAGRDYSEIEVNEILKTLHDDFPYLRRLLIEFELLDRDPRGSSYRLIETED